MCETMKWVLMTPETLIQPRAQAEHAEFLQTVDDVFGVLVVVLQLAGYRQDLRVHEVADGIENVALYLSETFGLQETTHAQPPSGIPAC